MTSWWQRFCDWIDRHGDIRDPDGRYRVGVTL